MATRIDDGLFKALVPTLTFESFEALLAQFREDEVEAINEAQRLYDNTTEPERSASISDETYKSRCEAWTPVTYTAMLTDKIADMLVGRNCTRTTGNTSWDKVLEEAVWGAMPRFTSRITKLAILGGATGVRLRPSWPYGVEYSDLGLNSVTLLYDPENPHGRPIGYVYDVLINTIEAQEGEVVKGSEKQEPVHLQEIETRHIRDEVGNIVVPGIHCLYLDGNPIPLDDGGYNLLGDYLSTVYWRCMDHPTDVGGRSLIVPLLQQLNGLNEMLTDGREKEVWGLHSPIWTDTASKPDIKYGPRSILVLGPRPDGTPGTIGRLQNDTDFDGYLAFLKTYVNMLHSNARVPSIGVGDLDGIGVVGSSGRSYEIALSPLLDLIRQMELVEVQQELELIETTVAFLAYYEHDGFTGLLEPNPNSEYGQPDMIKIKAALSAAAVEWEPIRLAEDKTEKANRLAAMVGAVIMSEEVAIREYHPSWSDEQIKAELEKVGKSDSQQVDAGSELRIRLAQARMLKDSSGGAAGNGQAAEEKPVTS